MWDQSQVINLLSAISSKLDTLSSKLDSLSSQLDALAAAQAFTDRLLLLLTVSLVLAAFTFMLSRWFKK